MPIAIGTILIFSLFANNVLTAGTIGMGQARISPRYFHLADADWHNS